MGSGFAGEKEGFRPFSLDTPKWDWLEIWSFGRYCLELTDAGFWELTMAQLDALAERYRDNQEWLDFRAGLICSVIANCNRTSGSKTFSPEDFMSTKHHDADNLLEQSPDAQLRRLLQLNAAAGGKLVELNP